MPPKTQSHDKGKTIFIVSENFDQQFSVDTKTDLNAPQVVPANFNHKDKGKPIKWVTSFGFKPKAGAKIDKNKLDDKGYFKNKFSEKYTVRIEKQGETVWCWDGKSLTTESYVTSHANGKTYLDITLDKGDPMLGLT